MALQRHKPGKSIPALCLLFVVILSLFIAGCGSNAPSTGSTGSTGNTASTPNASAQPTVAPPTGLLTPGTLTVGSDTTYAPMEYVDTTSGQTTGFDVDLITAIAQRMGLKVQIQKTGFDTIFDDLNNKRFDVVISSVTVNADREKKFDFVPYFNAGESLLVQKGNPKHISTTADLCGLNVGVQNGTTEQNDLNTANAACKSKGKSTINLTVLQDQTAVVQLLANGRVDATYQDSPVTDYYNKINPGQFEVGGSIVSPLPYGITIRKGDSSKLTAIQTAFKQLQGDGSYDKLFDKWQLTKTQKYSAAVTREVTVA